MTRGDGSRARPVLLAAVLISACGGSQPSDPIAIVEPEAPEPEMDPLERTIRYNLSVSLVDENQYARAWPHIEALLEVGNDTWPIHLAAAQVCLYWQMDYDCVREHAGRVLEISANIPRAYALLGRAAHDDGDRAAAIEYYRIVLDMRGSESGIAILLARLLEAEGELAEASDVLQRALAHSPTDGRLMLHLAVLVEESDPTYAEELYSTSAALHDDPTAAYGHLIRFYERQGRHQDAEEVRRRVEAILGVREMRPIR